MPDTLIWPPRKEDLERLYLEKRLSAMKIAKVYGLSYPSPKTAESMVLHHLKRNGIVRRDAAAHIRKVTVEMADEWVRRYQAGESLKQIAGNKVGPVTVWSHLKARGIELRGKVEAQIKAVTKYQRRPFSGNRIERAYLMGLRYGDLDVVRHGRAVRVRLSTTHPAMADLFESSFSRYGHISKYPRECQFTGYEWNLECDLEESFGFLLLKPAEEIVAGLTDEEFLEFLAGFLDAEGSVYLHEKTSGYAPEISVTCVEKWILQLTQRRLAGLGIMSKVCERKQGPTRLGYELPGQIWNLTVWQFDSVKGLLRHVKFKYPEKSAKANFALQFVQPLGHFGNSKMISDWDKFSESIESQRVDFVNRAMMLLQERVV